jgi:hypothetical protein
MTRKPAMGYDLLLANGYSNSPGDSSDLLIPLFGRGTDQAKGGCI